MAAISDWLEDAFMTHMLRGSDALGIPPQSWVALFTAAPSDAGGGTEVTGGSYARQRVFQDTTTAPFWTAPAETGEEMRSQNSGEIAFPQATADWGTITHVGIFSASAVGNLLWWGALTQSKTIQSGDQFKFAAGDLKLGID